MVNCYLTKGHFITVVGFAVSFVVSFVVGAAVVVSVGSGVGVGTGVGVTVVEEDSSIESEVVGSSIAISVVSVVVLFLAESVSSTHPVIREIKPIHTITEIIFFIIITSHYRFIRY